MQITFPKKFDTPKSTPTDLGTNFQKGSGEVNHLETQTRFTLLSMDIRNATVLSQEDLKVHYQEFIGTEVTGKELSSIAQRITAHYRNEGYFLTRAVLPIQEIKNGHLSVDVVEGRIADVEHSGSLQKHSYLKKYFEVLRSEQPLTLKTYERILLLISDVPGLDISDTTLEELGQGTGLFRLTLYTETWRLWSGFDLDNRGSKAIGRLQAYNSTSINSLSGRGDSLSIDISAVPDAWEELSYGRLSYSFPIGSVGSSLYFSGSFRTSSPDDYRKLVDTTIETEHYEIKFSTVPLRSREKSMWLSAYLGIHDEVEENNSGIVYKDRIRTLGANLDFQSHTESGASIYITASVKQGLSILNASDKNDLSLSNSDGNGEFTKGYFAVANLQSLSERLSIKLSAEGQIASTALLSSEEFGLGGAIFGRAYDSGEISGDDGIAGSVELRFDGTTENPFIEGFQLYTFLDAGSIWDHTTYGSDQISLASIGGGVRLYLRDDFETEFEIAKPVDIDSNFSNEDDIRFYFSVSKSFRSCISSIDTSCGGRN